jgi:hypothetical protein
MDTIVGHCEIIEDLNSLVEGGRCHHAFIFSGPRGVGKCAVGVVFAKKLLNTNSDSHPDLHIVRKEDVVWSSNPSLQKKKQTSIPLDLLREKMIGGNTSDNVSHDSLVYKTPTKSNRKVFIIDEAELLGEAGQNALLKTLEEPPPNTTIILISARDDLLLPTVHSRCNRVDFSPLNDQEMLVWVKGQPVVEDEGLEWILRFACGSPGLATIAFETNIYQLWLDIGDFIKKPSVTHYTNIVGVILGFVHSFIDHQLNKNKNASKESLNRTSLELVLMVFGLHVRTLLRQDEVARGVVLAAVLTGVESQISTNISAGVLIESLVVRWKCACAKES